MKNSWHYYTSRLQMVDLDGIEPSSETQFNKTELHA